MANRICVKYHSTTISVINQYILIKENLMLASTYNDIYAELRDLLNIPKEQLEPARISSKCAELHALFQREKEQKEEMQDTLQIVRQDKTSAEETSQRLAQELATANTQIEAEQKSNAQLSHEKHDLAAENDSLSQACETLREQKQKVLKENDQLYRRIRTSADSSAHRSARGSSQEERKTSASVAAFSRRAAPLLSGNNSPGQVSIHVNDMLEAASHYLLGFNLDLCTYPSSRNLSEVFSSLPAGKEDANSAQPLKKMADKSEQTVQAFCKTQACRLLVFSIKRSTYRDPIKEYPKFSMTHKLISADGVEYLDDTPRRITLASLKVKNASAISASSDATGKSEEKKESLPLLSSELHVPTLAVFEYEKKYYQINPTENPKNICAAPKNTFQWLHRLALMGVLIALSDALGHGMLAISLLNENKDIDIEADPRDHLALFLPLAFAASFTKFVYGLSRLNHFWQHSPLGKFALFHPSMNKLDMSIFSFWTLLVAGIDCLITYKAVSTLTGRGELAAFIAFGDFVQFNLIEGAALSEQFKSSLLEADRSFWNRHVEPDSRPRHIAAVLAAQIAINLFIMFGMSSITCLAISEILGFLGNKGSKVVWFTTACLASIYYIYNLSLFGMEIKHSFYWVIELILGNKKFDLHERIQKEFCQKPKRGSFFDNYSRLYKTGRALLLLAPLLLVPYSTFLAVITAQTSMQDLLSVPRGLTYTAGSVYGLMSFAVIQSFTLRWLFPSSEKEDIHEEIGLKEVYTLSDFFNDVSILYLFMLPHFIYDAYNSSKQVDFESQFRVIPAAITGLIFAAMYLLNNKKAAEQAGQRFKLCDFSCYSGGEYDFQFHIGEPVPSEIDKYPTTVFIYLRNSVPYYYAANRNMGQSPMTRRLYTSDLVIKQLEELKTRILDTDEDPNELDTSKELECILTAANKTAIKQNVYWHYPLLVSAIADGLICASLNLAGTQLIRIIIGTQQSAGKVRLEPLAYDIVGVALSAILSLVHFKLRKQQMGQERPVDRRNIYALDSSFFKFSKRGKGSISSKSTPKGSLLCCCKPSS